MHAYDIVWWRYDIEPHGTYIIIMVLKDYAQEIISIGYVKITPSLTHKA